MYHLNILSSLACWPLPFVLSPVSSLILSFSYFLSRLGAMSSNGQLTMLTFSASHILWQKHLNSKQPSWEVPLMGELGCWPPVTGLQAWSQAPPASGHAWALAEPGPDAAARSRPSWVLSALGRPGQAVISCTPALLATLERAEFKASEDKMQWLPESSSPVLSHWPQAPENLWPGSFPAKLCLSGATQNTWCFLALREPRTLSSVLLSVSLA